MDCDIKKDWGEASSYWCDVEKNDWLASAPGSPLRGVYCYPISEGARRMSKILSQLVSKLLLVMVLSLLPDMLLFKCYYNGCSLYFDHHAVQVDSSRRVAPSSWLELAVLVLMIGLLKRFSEEPLDKEILPIDTIHKLQSCCTLPYSRTKGGTKTGHNIHISRVPTGPTLKTQVFEPFCNTISVVTNHKVSIVWLVPHFSKNAIESARWASWND